MLNLRDASRSARIALALLSLGLGAAALAEPAGEQALPKPPKDTAPDDELQEIVVTGSRIARPNLERLQPTTILSSDFLDKRANTNIIDSLSELPAFGEPDNNLTGAQSSFGAGQSFANLYGLGSERTLTLVDGRRFVGANTPSIFGATGNGGEQVDLNVIPTGLIDRIEVIGVGGAPIYGADAIAGTINIIMKHDFEGLQVDAEGGISGHGDASQSRFRALAGKNFDDNRGNITVSAEFANSDPLLGTQRQRYAEQLQYFVPNTPSPYAYVLANNFRWGFISTSGVPMTSDGVLNFNNNGITSPTGQLLAFNKGALAPYNLGPIDGSGVDNFGGDGVNFAQTQTLLTALERINLSSLGDYQINDYVRVFEELWYSETHAFYPVDQGAYDTGLFANAGGPNGNLILSSTNPFLSAADQATIQSNLAAAGSPTNQFYLARLNQDLQNGSVTADQNTRRVVLGIEGKLPLFGNDYHYEISGNYGETINSNGSQSIVWQNYANALNAVTNASGQIVCAPGYVNSPVATNSKTCAPFNPFGNGIASPASVAYITTLAQSTSTLTQRDFNASINGNLFPLWAGPVKAAFGYENRRESADFAPDAFFQQAAGYDIPIGGLAGSFMSNEVFGELLVPLVAPAQSIPAVHRVELEGAIRDVDQSVAGKALTWTAGLRFEPVSTVQVHGNYTRSIRAPSVTEAFLPTSEAYQTAADPCDKSLINSGPDPAVRAANCAKAGIVQPFTSNILNFTEPVTVSGDPTLQNERADARTYGFTLRPTEKLSWTVDWVSIDIEQAIVSFSPTNVLDACYDSPNYASNPYCADISRSANGQITLVKTGYTNAGYENFNGVQTEFDWSFDVPFARAPGGLGTVDLRLNYFLENHLKQAVGEADVTSFAGQLGNSRNRATLDINWQKGGLYALWQARFIGRAVWDNSLPSSTSAVLGVGNWWVHNLTAGYDVDKHLRFQLVVDNLFDKEEPYPLPAIPPSSSGSSGIESYFSGVMGRYFLGQATYKF